MRRESDEKRGVDVIAAASQERSAHTGHVIDIFSGTLLTAILKTTQAALNGGQALAEPLEELVECARAY